MEVFEKDVEFERQLDRCDKINELTQFLKSHNVEAIIWNEGDGKINDRYEIELRHIATLIIDGGWMKNFKLDVKVETPRVMPKLDEWDNHNWTHPKKRWP